LTSLSEIAKTAVWSSLKPTPFRRLRDGPSGENLGWIAPSITSIGPDWVANSTTGLMRK
jgi:hypothetical protein